MREEVLDVISHAGRSLDLIEIAYAIFVEPTSKDLEKLTSILTSLIENYEVEINKKGKYQLSTMIKGRLELNSKGFGFVVPEQGDIDFHIAKEFLNGALDGDVVVMEKLKPKFYTKEENNEGRIVKIVKRNMANLVGEIYFDNGEMKVKLKNSDIKVKLDQKDKDKYLEGQIVLLEETDIITKKTIEAKIKSTLGYKGEPDVDVKIIALKYGLRLEFPEKVIDEASKVPLSITEKDTKGRKDFRDLDLFTIDGDDTKDIDDAVYAERLDDGNYRMLVCIADVAHYVKPGSAIYEEAYLRGTSNYLTSNYVIPELHQNLSNGICSLNPNVDRLCVAFDMIIDKTGDIKDIEISDGVMRSRKQMTYKEVNKLFDGNPSEDYKPFESRLHLMKEIADLVRSKRDEKGALDFEVPEPKIILDDDGEPVSIQKANRGIGEMLIEDFMVTTNIAYGTYIYNLGVPALYRVHDAPSSDKIDEFLKFASLLGIHLKGNLKKENVRSKDFQKILEQLKETEYFEMCSKKLLRTQRKAIYDPDNIGHFALAVPSHLGYIQITSPIRRGPDLENHIIGKELRHNDNFLMDTDKLEEISVRLTSLGDHFSKMERNAEECEREVDSYEMAKYMSKHVGEQFDGVIDGLISKGFFVELDNLISGLVASNTLPGNYVYNENLMAFTSPHDHRGFRLGDKVKVECIGADPETRSVDFKLVLKGGKNGNSK